MEADEKWYFSKEQLANTPSRRCGYDADRELSCRQQAANFIQDMGQRLQVTQLCINTAIVYMHRFYVFHSFTQFHRNAMAAAALFLAAKVEEQPRKLEHVIKVAQMCLHRELPTVDVKSEQYMEQAQDLVMNENVLLQTLGFDVAIDHPHTHVVRCCHLVKASKDLAQTSYFMASNSLHLTTMCLQYKPTVVACFCIHLACKWSNWEIPLSNEKKSWFWYVDRTVTQDLLEQLTDEFLKIFDKCPSRLKRKISANQNMTGYMNVNELNQKRMPGPSGVDPQQGVSFQQMTRNRPTEDNRKKPDGNQIPPNHRQLLGSDFNKKPPPPHSISREVAYGYHVPPMAGSSQSGGSGHQSSSGGAQFMYPAGPGSNGPSRPPGGSAPPANTKPVARPPPPPPDPMFPPPKRSGTAPPPLNRYIKQETQSPSPIHNLPVSRSIKQEVQSPVQAISRALKQEVQSPVNRQIKQEVQSPLQHQTSKTSHSVSHHMPRNGTSHTSETIAQQHIKTENTPLKYPISVDKHSSNHQKNHSKMYDSSRVNQVGGSGNWANTSDVTGRSSMNDSKYMKNEIKTEKLTPPSYHIQTTQLPVAVSSIKQSISPPPLPASLPPPPPPPPVVPHPTSKPSSIFSPDKMTPPLPPSPPHRDIKQTVLSPMLLSPIATSKSGRNRTSSSSSEPELIPVILKLEDMSGFESIAKGKTAIKLPGKVPETVHQPKEKRKESSSVTKEIKSSPVIIESQPAPMAIPTPAPTAATAATDTADGTAGSSKREHKKKKKHKEHRDHKDKDRDKEREKKKDKHKEKHREKDKDKEKEKDKDKEKDKHRTDPAPIKIKIPKDKINKGIIQDKLLPPATMSDQGTGLKIKIPKDKFKPQVEVENKTPSSLKIKISKDAISSHSSSKSSSSSASSSKKRERSSHRNSEEGYSHPSKHAKISKTNGDYRLVE